MVWFFAVAGRKPRRFREKVRGCVRASISLRYLESCGWLARSSTRLHNATAFVVRRFQSRRPGADSGRNHLHICEQIGAESIVPAKRGKPSWKIPGVRAQMRAAFPTARYRQRVHAETVFSAIKRKLSAKAPGRSLTTQRKQALLLGLVYNIYKLWPLHFRPAINA